MFRLSYSLLLVISSSESHLSSLSLLESCREFFKWPMMLQILVSSQIRHSSSSHGMLAQGSDGLAPSTWLLGSSAGWGVDFWQSCGSQGQHWIRLEMQPEVAVQSLKMVVDPADSIYMPSLVVVSGGDSLSSLKEITSVNVYGNDTTVNLLDNVNDYFKYFEIAIKQCRNGGINCMIYGLQAFGRK